MSGPYRAAAFFASIVVLAASTSRAAPVSQASYTTQQAWQGRLSYYRTCAECHGGSLGGVFGPALAGGNDNLQYQAVNDVYDYMTAHMPHGNPESLPENEYLAIMAFLMQSHGLPAGSRELTKASVERDASLMGGAK